MRGPPPAWGGYSLQTALCIKRQELCVSNRWCVPYLCGPAAGPVWGPDGDVDAGRGLRIGCVAPFSSGQPRDNQTTGETTLPKQQTESGRRRGDLGHGDAKWQKCSSCIWSSTVRWQKRLTLSNLKSCQFLLQPGLSAADSVLPGAVSWSHLLRRDEGPEEIQRSSYHIILLVKAN